MNLYEKQLFDNGRLILTACDLEQDPAVESAWSHDLLYGRWLLDEPARPMTVFELKKLYEKQAKESDENGRQFNFAVRLKEDGKLVGFIRIPWVMWNNNLCKLRLYLPDDEAVQAHGEELMQLALNFIFRELNLELVMVDLSEAQAAQRTLIEKHGFSLDVRRREALYQHGKLWDELIYSMRSAEWFKQVQEAA